MVLSALALNQAVCALALSATVVVGARTEARARSYYPGDFSSFFAAADSELSVAARLSHAFERARLELSYSPTVLFREPYAGNRPELLQIARAGGTFTLSPFSQLSASQYASYGYQDFSTLALQSDPTVFLVEPLPPIIAAQAVSLVSQVSLDGELSSLTRAGLVLGYLVSGGVDERSQLVLPLQRGPTARLSLATRLSALDLLNPDARVAHADFSNGQQASLGELLLRYVRRLSLLTDLEPSVGASAIRLKRRGEADAPTVWYPSGGVRVVHRPPARTRRWELRGIARTEPFIDRFAGTVYQRAEATFELTWSNELRIRVEGRGGAAVVLSGEQRGDLSGALEGRAAYALDRLWTVDVSLQNGWTQQPRLSNLVLHQWALTVGIGLSERGDL